MAADWYFKGVGNFVLMNKKDDIWCPHLTILVVHMGVSVHDLP